MSIGEAGTAGDAFLLLREHIMEPYDGSSGKAEGNML